MASYYKLKTPNGLVRKFINTNDGFAESEIVDYWFEGCEVELIQSAQSFKDEKIRTVPVEELKEKAN